MWPLFLLVLLLLWGADPVTLHKKARRQPDIPFIADASDTIVLRARQSEDPAVANRQAVPGNDDRNLELSLFRHATAPYLAAKVVVTTTRRAESVPHSRKQGRNGRSLCEPEPKHCFVLGHSLPTRLKVQLARNVPESRAYTTRRRDGRIAPNHHGIAVASVSRELLSTTCLAQEYLVQYPTFNAYQVVLQGFAKRNLAPQDLQARYQHKRRWVVRYSTPT